MGALRSNHIDMLKGFTILWVILMHLDIEIPLFNASVQMPIFFLFAGCFFKYKIDYKEFFIKRVNSLIIPFLFFWILSIVILFFRREIYPNIGYLQNINWLDINDIFGRYSYLEVNILWFLAALIYMHFKYYLFYRLPYTERTKNFLALIYCSLSYLAGIYLFSKNVRIPNFPLAEILTFQQYFVTGIIFGKFFIDNYNKKLVLACAVVYVSFYFISQRGGVYSVIGMPMMAYTFCYLAASVFFYTRSIEFNKIFQYFGEYSIVVYLTHMFLIHNSVVDKLLNINNLSLGG